VLHQESRGLEWIAEPISFFEERPGTRRSAVFALSYSGMPSNALVACGHIQLILRQYLSQYNIIVRISAYQDFNFQTDFLILGVANKGAVP
jgi:hypothetical protein